MSFEWQLARRFGWKADESKGVSPAVGVAIAGVALAMVVMLLSVSIMLGFKDEVTRRIINLDDAITINGYESTFPPEEVVSAITLPEGYETVSHTSVPSILKTADDFLGLELRRNDDLNVADTAVVLSESSTSKLKLNVGDRIAAYFFIDDRLRVRNLTLTDTYNSGFAEHDNAVGYCGAGLPPTLLGFPQNQVQSLGIRPRAGTAYPGPEQISTLSAGIYSELLGAYYSGNLPHSFTINNVVHSDANFFSWLGLLDTNVAVIITLMALVAAFTLVSSLFIIILERVHTIGLLKSLGATNGQIRRIFMMMTERLVISGLVIGNVVGLGMIAFQAATHAIPLDAANYYVDFVPVEFSLGAILWLNIGALAVSWVVLMLPAMIISRISPATTLRYE
ncbi:MAG: FtsX-like permease family protein [Bacteroides sp.]|nr:FtsX-like permease family protein [Bacteroides sp.]MCM1380263.1 FtsX-like permease family protein [Bacteroides sp.]MCM1446570.1 FtsX-like permease family protein [Prevotella sp.]